MCPFCGETDAIESEGTGALDEEALKSCLECGESWYFEDGVLVQIE